MSLCDFRAAFMPYCLQRMPDGKYAVLNREYKPVGFYTNSWVEYEKFPVTVRLKGLTKKTVAALSYRGDTNLNRIYLYRGEHAVDSNEQSMAEYLKRLARLAKYKIDPNPEDLGPRVIPST